MYLDQNNPKTSDTAYVIIILGSDNWEREQTTEGMSVYTNKNQN